MPYRQRRSRSWLFWVMLGLVWLLCSGTAWADSIRDRLQQFPDWTDKPQISAAAGDLYYPEWMAGEWQVQTTLLDMVAPLAPEIETPGFESNRQFLNQPVSFTVRFLPETHIANQAPLVEASSPSTTDPRQSGVIERSPQVTAANLTHSRLAGLGAAALFGKSWPIPATAQGEGDRIVSDRAFNGYSLATAYLGGSVVKAVKVDPENPNRQITLLNSGAQLTSTVTGRQIDQPDADHFLTTEVFQQVFRGGSTPYFNEVETTTAYQRLDPRQDAQGRAIVADQVTAIYLSPQDSNYFSAINRPVALYRYRLDFRHGL